MNIGHVAFNCKDLSKSVAFYRDILGGKEKFTITYEQMARRAMEERQERGQAVPEYLNALLGFGDKPWVTYVELGETTFVELFNIIGAVNERIPGNQDLNYSHCSLTVEDIHGLRQTIIARGGEEYLDTQIDVGVDGSLEMWMHDVDGNKLEFMEYTEDSLQCR